MKKQLTLEGRQVTAVSNALLPRLYRFHFGTDILMELQKFITMLQQRLDESEEELQLIVDQIQSAIGKIADLITSATDQSAEIANNIGQMA